MWAAAHFRGALSETVDDEQFIEMCRRSNLLQSLVERLLALDRRQDAITDAQGARDYELLELADVFVRHDLGST